MTSRADAVGSPSSQLNKGASGQEIALRFYRAVMVVSIILILINLT